MDRTPSVDQPARPTHRRVLMATLLVVAVAVLVLDQATKAWALAALDEYRPVDVVGGLLRFDLTHNPGSAFTFAPGMTWIFPLIAVVVSLAILRVARRLGSRWWALALGLLLGGALGNLVDRMIRPPGVFRGEVVDFLQLPHWPVFNVADSCIVTAAVLIGVLGWRGIGVDGRPAER